MCEARAIVYREVLNERYCPNSTASGAVLDMDPGTRAVAFGPWTMPTTHLDV